MMLDDDETEFMAECCHDHHAEVRRMAEDCLRRRTAQQIAEQKSLSDALFLLGVTQL